MNRDFKLRFDQMRSNNPAQTDPDPEYLPMGERVEASSSVRNLAFLWPDGRRAFLNYAYLVSAEYEPGQDSNLIRLSFTSHNVTLTGYGLDALFEQLMDHLPRTIEMVDARYAAHAGGGIQVTGIRMDLVGV